MQKCICFVNGASHKVGFLPLLNLQFLLLLTTNRYQTGICFFLFFFFVFLDSCNSFGTAVLLLWLRRRGGGWHLQLMVAENDALKSRMAFKEAETIIIIRIIILVRNSSNIQAVTRISETTPVQNENRATTRLEPAIVSRHQQLLGGGWGYSQT